MHRKLNHLRITFKDEMPIVEAQIVRELDDVRFARFEPITVDDLIAIVSAAKQDRIAAITQVFGQPTDLES